MSILKLLLRLLLALLEGAAAAYGALLLWHMAWSWHHGGTVDPRCLFGWKGYVEHHYYGADYEHVTCEYAPELEQPRE